MVMIHLKHREKNTSKNLHRRVNLETQPSIEIRGRIIQYRRNSSDPNKMTKRILVQKGRRCT